MLVTVMTCLPVAAQAFSFSFSAHPTFAVKQTGDFAAKGQQGMTVAAAFTVPLGESFFLQFGGRCFGFRPSAAGSDWVIYRGFSGLAASAGVGIMFPEVSLFQRLPLIPSLAFRGSHNFSSYRYTDIYFLFFSFEVEPMLQLLSFNKNQMALQAGVPFAWHYQRDVDLFLTAGLAVRILFLL